MPKTIPPDARTLRIPHIGELAVFKEGLAWHAVYPDFEDVRLSPRGKGPTPLDAVAELLTDDCS
jgi:hypothetical protein